MTLWIIAFATIEALLFYVPWEVAEYWIIFSCVLVAPIFGLSHLPEKKSVSKKINALNNFARFIIKYAFFPAVCVYFIILYIYSIKLGISFWDWPKWEISWLVIGFSVLGYITYILSSLYEKENTGIAVFRRYFPYLVLPQVIILFYSIYLRIAQYDLTINRYCIVVFGICLGVLSLYFILSKEKRLIAFPVSFLIVPIFVSVGPWSVYQLPASSQLASLKWELVEANILQWNTIVPLANKTDISEELSNSIYTKIDYLCDYHSCHGLQELFSEQYPVSSNKDVSISKWEIVRSISEKIRVERSYNYNHHEYFSVYMDSWDSFFPLDISGYSQIIRIENSLNYNTQILSLQNNDRIDTLDMKQIFESLEWKNNNRMSRMSADELSYIIDTPIGSVQLLLENINWNKSGFGDMYISGYILLP